MLVRAYWPDCDSGAAAWGKGRRMDALWVEATQQEAEAELLPFLPSEVVERSRFIAQNSFVPPALGDPPRPYCYLVAVDLSVFVPFKSSYPFSHMWNAYSPFVLFAPSVVISLDELKQFKVPEGLEVSGIAETCETPGYKTPAEKADALRADE